MNRNESVDALRKHIDQIDGKIVALLNDRANVARKIGQADVAKALASKGIKPVAVEKFNIKDVDMTAQLLKAKEAGAEAVRHDHHVFGGLVIQIVRMDDKKTDALEIGRLLRRPDCAYNFC